MTRLDRAAMILDSFGYATITDEADRGDNYPGDIAFGFDKELWFTQCRKIHASDHDPPFRGEQRAWYDTLRDFVPLVKGLCPTLRLFASEYEWCSLKPESARDVETFRQILAERVNFWKLEFSDDISPILARVIVDGPWRGDSPTAQRLLEDICEHWPEGKKVYCLTTCGRVSALRLAAQHPGATVELQRKYV